MRFSSSQPVVTNGTFFLVDGPPRDPLGELEMSLSSASVPYGSFTTLRARHDYTETGQYATEDIFDAAAEHYADQVGLVRGWWDYSYDDNDPRGTDTETSGTIELTHMDSGPFPDFVSEDEPNDDYATPTSATDFSISSARIQDGDSGLILDDAEIGCGESVCVYPDVHGDKLIQDWFRLDLTEETALRIELDFATYDSSIGQYNDLDLYIFTVDENGDLLYLGRSVSEPGNREAIAGTATAGTLYVGLQAWETPSGRIPYWLAIW